MAQLALLKRKDLVVRSAHRWMVNEMASWTFWTRPGNVSGFAVFLVLMRSEDVAASMALVAQLQIPGNDLLE